MHAGALCLLLFSWGGFSGAAAGDTLRAAQVTGAVGRPVAAPSDTVSAFRLGGGVSAAEAMKGLGGLQVKDYGGAGGLKTIDVRSLGSAHTAVFLDGIAVDNAQNQQVDLGRFSTEGLSGISLYAGQASASLMSAREYGSAASVYLETARPQWGKESRHLSARVRAGSFGTFSPSVVWEQRLSARLALRAAAEGTVSHGRYPFRARHIQQGADGLWRGYDTVLVRENGDLSCLRAEVHFFGEVPRGEWSAKGYAYLSDRGYPGPVVRRPEAVPLSADRQSDADFFLQGDFRKRLTSRYSLRARGRLAETRTRYATHPEINPMAIPYDNHYRQRQGYVSVAHQYLWTSALSFQAATDLQYQTLVADIAQFVPPERMTFYGAGAVRWAGARFRATGSLLYTVATDRFRAGEDVGGGFRQEDRTRTAWTPALVLSYEPWKCLTLSGFLKRSCRMPSFNDLYYTLVGNSRLLPEYADQADLAVKLNLPLAPWRFSLSGECWRNRVRDKIIAVPTANQFRWSMYNIGKVDITGTDVVMTLRREAPLQAGISLRYTFQRALDRTDADALTFGQQIPYVPLHSGTVTLDIAWRGWAAECVTLLTGRRFSSSANLPEYAVAPWTTTDLSVSHDFTKMPGRAGHKGKGVTLRLSVNNLFGRQYEIVRGYPMPGCNVFLTAIVKR